MPEENEKWTDRKKFVTETFRTIILAILGTIAIFLLVKPKEVKIAYDADLEKTKLAIKAKVVDDFTSAAHRYTAEAYDACKAYSKTESDRSIQEKELIKKFESTLVDEYRSSMERLGLYFEDNKLITLNIQKVDKLHRDLVSHCKCDLVKKEKWEAERKELGCANLELAQIALTDIGIRKKVTPCRLEQFSSCRN